MAIARGPQAIKRLGGRTRARTWDPLGEWPAVMPADMTAAYLGYRDTGELARAVSQGEAPSPIVIAKLDTQEDNQSGRRPPLITSSSADSVGPRKQTWRPSKEPARTALKLPRYCRRKP